MRVAFDTNVVISALIFPSELMDETFRIASAPGNRLVLPAYVVDETVDVVGRKWPDMTKTAVAFLALLDYETVEWDASAGGPDVSIRDPNDYLVIAGAIESRCDVLVTGDRDFEDLMLDKPRVMTPREFVDVFGVATS